MARVKCTPRVAQQNPEAPPPSAMDHVASNIREAENSPMASSAITNSTNIEVDEQAAKDLMLMRLSVQPLELDESMETRLPLLANSNPTCPQCRVIFPQMGISDFREHVESCTRPTTPFSETSNDSLSPPPQSLLGEEELDHLTAYHVTAIDSYPGSRPEGSLEESVDEVGGLQRVTFPRITEVAKFVASFEGMEEMDYATLYRRTASAQRALVEWQDEWLDLDAALRTRDPAATAKEQKNPRVPKAGLIGIGYQDQLEASVYGYEHNTHHKAVGMQDPVSQRLANGSNGGRELRQRVPTQKAAEADMSTTPESEDEGGRRRMRGRKAREGTVGVDAGPSRISRIRNESRMNSESRDPTPMKTFVSTKAAGRPRKQNVAARFQELHPIAQTLATTESWASNAGFDAVDSRPMTSSSATTAVSTDDMRVPTLRASTRVRKRQNTSDFEDALPHNKRIKPARPAEISAREASAPGTEPAGALADGEMEPDVPLGLADTIGPKNKRDKGKANSAKGKGLKGAEGPGPAPRKDVKEGPKPSRASLNMRRRWAAKKKAEALGLPVPKIGRYPKAEAAASTQDAADPPAQANSPKPTTGRKRKRNDEPEEIEADGENAAGEPSVPAKRRGGRPKAVKAEPENNAFSNIDELAADFDGANPVPIRNNTEPGDSGLPVATKKKAGKIGKVGKVGKAKKVAPEVEPSTLNVKAVADHRDGVMQNQPLTLSSHASDAGEEANAPSVSPEPDRAMREENNTVIESQEQAPPPRTSGRIRRQTSAALSSQAGTRPPSRQKQTVTPTPVPTQQAVEEQKVEEAQPAATILPRKRGQQPSSANLAINSQILSVPRESVDDLESEPAPKRRKAGRRPKGLTSEDVPPAVMGSVEVENVQELPIAKRRGGRPKKVVVDKKPGTAATSDDRVPQKEVPITKKRNQSVKEPKNGIASAPIILPGVVLDGNVAVRAPRIRFKKIVRPDPILPPGRTRAESTDMQAESAKPSAKNARGGLRVKKERVATSKTPAEENATDAWMTTSGSSEEAGEVEEEVLDEEAAKKAALESAKLSKSAKMSAAMKARWENGSMKAVMDKKKAANKVRKALKTQSAAGPAEAQPPIEPESAPTKRKVAATEEEPIRTSKRRRNMASTMDGAADSDSESDTARATLSRRSMPDRILSEYDQFQELTSPSTVPSRRQRRPAALRASQSFSMFRDTNGDDENDLADTSSNEEDEETEIKKQFDSEYDHFQAVLASPSDAPGILTGKRKRKPVMNLEEAMRIEASEDEENFGVI